MIREAPATQGCYNPPAPPNCRFLQNTLIHVRLAREGTIFPMGVPELIGAVTGGSEADVRRVLATGPDLEARDAEGHTALHYAALEDQPGMVLALLEAGADPWAKDNDDWIAILHAAEVGATKSIRALASSRQSNALLNHRGPRGNTPLHIAAHGRNHEAIEVLLKHGAEVNARRENGHTPLHVAVTYGSAETILLLVEGGADTTVTDEDGRTPRDLYQAKGNTYRLDVDRLLATASTRH